MRGDSPPTLSVGHVICVAHGQLAMNLFYGHWKGIMVDPPKALNGSMAAVRERGFTPAAFEVS